MSTWTAITPPPKPTALNIFPDAPAKQQVLSVSLPDQITLNHGLFASLTLTVQAQWQKILEGTSQPASAFQQSQSVTMGTSVSDSDTSKFSAGLGCKDDLFSVSASLSTSVEKKVSFSTSVTEEITFNISNSSVPVSAVWWQLVYYYELNGEVLGNWPSNWTPTGTLSASIAQLQREYASSEFVSS